MDAFGTLILIGLAVQVVLIVIGAWLLRRIFRVNERTEYLRSIDLSLRQLPAVQQFYIRRQSQSRIRAA